MPTNDDDTLLPFTLPSICQKKVTDAFDGGLISSDGGVLLLAGADKRLGLVDTLAAIIPDHRDQAQITHTMSDILRAPILAIACGYPGGDDLASQPTMSRWENAPDLRTLIRLTYAMVDLWCKSYRRPPKSIMLDIDDTADTVHGPQQLSLFNAHYDERCFLPIHIYDAATGHCVLVDRLRRSTLRPGKTPDGKEVRAHLRRLVRRIRRHWPNTQITRAADAFRHIGSLRDPIRGDSHYGRKEAMEWCEQNGVRYIFGLAPNKVLAEQIFPKLDECCVRRAIGQLDKVRDFTRTRYAAKSWSSARRVVARIEATRRGADVRYVVTNLKRGTAQHLYENVYCARGQAENLIKRHKSQLASDRTSCGLRWPTRFGCGGLRGLRPRSTASCTRRRIG